ncbi:hypothetical protein [Trichormus sp. NMC-1]|uniref:hypothetical protein n=1 Tax=Trichormus sp. NMC-1 TaxID=1853259 RepID=UPI0008DBF2D6
MTLLNQALATHWQILFEEPRRTLISLMAAYLLWILPKSLYQWLETLIMQITGATQQQRIQKEQMS